MTNNMTSTLIKTDKESFVQALRNFTDSTFALLVAWEQLEMGGELGLGEVPSQKYPFESSLDELFHKIADFRDDIVSKFTASEHVHEFLCSSVPGVLSCWCGEEKPTEPEAKL